MIKIEMLEEYGMFMNPADDMKTKEELIIIKGSKTKMEIAGNSYIYGHMRGSCGKRMVPLINLKQISDEEWNEMVRNQKEFRELMESRS